MTDDSFAGLLEQARRGDNEALTRLIEHYEPQIRRVARARLGESLRGLFDSMDVVQSVHRSLIGGLRAGRFLFHGPGDLVALAVTMVTRRVAHIARKIRREEEVLRLWELLERTASREPDPARDAELKDEVLAILNRLDDLDRQILLLYLEGRSTEEAAEGLAITPAHLRVRRHRIYKVLRQGGLAVTGRKKPPAG